MQYRADFLVAGGHGLLLDGLGGGRRSSSVFGRRDAVAGWTFDAGAGGDGLVPRP